MLSSLLVVMVMVAHGRVSVYWFLQVVEFDLAIHYSFETLMVRPFVYVSKAMMILILFHLVIMSVLCILLYLF